MWIKSPSGARLARVLVYPLACINMSRTLGWGSSLVRKFPIPATFSLHTENRFSSRSFAREVCPDYREAMTFVFDLHRCA